MDYAFISSSTDIAEQVMGDFGRMSVKLIKTISWIHVMMVYFIICLYFVIKALLVVSCDQNECPGALSVAARWCLGPITCLTMLPDTVECS